MIYFCLFVENIKTLIRFLNHLTSSNHLQASNITSSEKCERTVNLSIVHSENMSALNSIENNNYSILVDDHLVPEHLEIR